MKLDKLFDLSPFFSCGLGGFTDGYIICISLILNQCLECRNDSRSDLHFYFLVPLNSMLEPPAFDDCYRFAMQTLHDLYDLLFLHFIVMHIYDWYGSSYDPL